MAQHKDRYKNKNGKKPLSAEDAALWKDMTQDVDRLEGRDYEEGAPDDSSEDSPRVAGSVPASKDVPDRARCEVSSSPVPRGHEIDKRSDERLRKGQMKIDARLDLHGMNQGQAREALRAFVTDCYAQGFRCVLIVTGKGRTGKTAAQMDDAKPGILKRNVPLWLGEAGIGHNVLKFVSAKPQHGGGGALYVLLRRQR